MIITKTTEFTVNATVQAVSIENLAAENVALQYRDKSGWHDIIRESGDIKGVATFPTIYGRLEKSGNSEITFSIRRV